MPTQTDDAIFKQPLEDFDFDSLSFAKPAFAKVGMLATNGSQIPLKQQLAMQNDQRLDKLHQDVNQGDCSDLKQLAKCIEPFDLVKDDLEQTKAFAIDNILQTNYEKLRETSHYNLLAKGKNFRSAILFLLAKAIYYNQHAASGT